MTRLAKTLRRGKVRSSTFAGCARTSTPKPASPRPSTASTSSIYPGEVLGLVGESGSGKSVTALSVLRLIPDPPGRIVAGEILFKGRDLLKLDATRFATSAATRSA